MFPPSLSADREILFDVSRLIWRAWRGGLPTGIDRVCLAYLNHLRERALATFQYGGHYFVASASQSVRLFAMLESGRKISRFSIAAAVMGAVSNARSRPPKQHMLYVNVGHTGLNEPTLGDWVRKHALQAVFLVHDLIPITQPQFCRPGEEAKHRMRMENALGCAAGIIGNSKATIEDLKHFAREESLPMPANVAAWISGHKPNMLLTAPETTRPYFLVLGTIEGRKNHHLLLEVWQRLIATDPKNAPDLIIVGQRGWQADDVFAMLDSPGQFAGLVHERNSCSDEQLNGLIKGAEALLMPSFAEGFGLPIIEGLQLGTPVLASDLPVFREIAGSIPLYLDSSEPQQWQDAIEAMLRNDLESRRQRSLMKNYRAPTWEDHFAIVDPWLWALRTAAAG